MKKIIKSFLIFIIIFPCITRAQAPIANFSATDTALCFPAGSDSIGINFRDLSTNNPTSWKWYFPGASPDTSTLENPNNIYYDTGGCYTVKLVVLNGSGSDSLTDSNYICLYPPPVVTINGQNEICQGSTDTITFSVFPGYFWSTGTTISTISLLPFASTTYTIEAKNGPCIVDTTVTIIVDTIPNIKFRGDTFICKLDSTTIYVSGGYTYLWSTGSTSDSIFVHDTTPGSYIYSVTVSKGACNRTAQITVKVHVCTGIEYYSTPIGIEIFPNPVSNNLSVVIDIPINSEEAIKINDITGRELMVQKVSPNQSQINVNVSSLVSGIYFLKLQTNRGVVVKKFIKE